MTTKVPIGADVSWPFWTLAMSLITSHLLPVVLQAKRHMVEHHRNTWLLAVSNTRASSIRLICSGRKTSHVQLLGHNAPSFWCICLWQMLTVLQKYPKGAKCFCMASAWLGGSHNRGLGTTTHQMEAVIAAGRRQLSPNKGSGGGGKNNMMGSNREDYGTWWGLDFY